MIENHEEIYARTYGVELFYKSKPNFDRESLSENIRRRCGNIEIKYESKSILIFFLDHLITYKDGQVPSQIAIMFTDKEINFDQLETSLQQSWGFNNARDVVLNSKYTVLVTDLMSSGLDYKVRIELFQKTLYTILEMSNCEAINWVRSEQVLCPLTYLDNHPDSENYDLLLGVINVRMFNIEGLNDEILMDTLGLSALGLPDLQCHFNNIEPNQIANLLYMYGDYIFFNGDVIEDGNTIQGITHEQKWVCRHEVSLLEPRRVVLDITPGEFAAGDRE